ncbi:MAG TPA: thioredoxin domain-containing protein [Candidatus Acidoferrum sp.]
MNNRTLTNVIAPVVVLLAATVTMAQQPPASLSQTQKNIEAFLRSYYALGPEIKITVGAPTEFASSGILESAIEVKTPENTEKIMMYITKDGRYLIRGEINDLTTDPLADTVKKIQTANSPVLGNPNAPITLVEYSDFECPVCRNLHDSLRGLLPKYPQVKVIFKDYPLDTIHPWARTAALAGRCAYQQDPHAFWKMYDSIYDNQDVISASNVYDKVMDYAGKAGLNPEVFKACMSAPETTQAIDASIANGNLLEVRSTPTVFVNGRRLVGADPRTVQQYLDYEVAQLKAGTAATKK